MKNNTQKVVLILACFMFLSILFVNDFKHALEFDSSFNLNVVKNIVFHGIYGTSVYLKDGQKYYWFDPWITTGPTILLPAALIIKFINNFVFIPRLLMNAFFIFFIYLLAKFIQISQKKLRLEWIAMYVVSLTVIFSKFISNATMLGIDFVGEIPAYLFVLISVAGFGINNPMVAGLSLAFAFLTKFQLIYFCFPLSLGYLYYFYKKNRKNAFIFIIGGVLPLLTYGGSLFLVYGKGVKQYYGDFKGVAIMQKAYPTMIGGITSIGNRFIHFMQYDPYFLLLSIIGIVVILLRWKKYDLKQKIIYASFVLYMGYFLFIWQFIAHRHLIIPKLFLFVLLCIVALEYISISHAKKLIVGMVLFSFLLFPSLLESGDALGNQITAANYLNRKYNDATIYNIGWWKSPELQILLNKDFIRLDKKNREFCKKDCKLIIADSILKLDSTIDPIVSKYQKIDSFNGYNMYDLEKPVH